MRSEATRTLDELFSFCEPIPFCGCWIWVDRSLGDAGYGQIWHEGYRWQAHRLAFTLLHGAVSAEFDLDHLCRIRCCINPEHLEPVTRKVNVQRGLSPELSRLRQVSKTHCRNGHEYSMGNTAYRKDGSRYCITCHREQSARAMKKLRAESRNPVVEALAASAACDEESAVSSCS